MGNSQSKALEPAISEKLTERLQALEVKENRFELDKGYVYINGEECEYALSYWFWILTPSLVPPYHPYSSTVSIGTAEQWEKKLMEDPKVSSDSRSASIPPHLTASEPPCPLRPEL